MIRLLPISTRTVTLCPDTTLFRTSQTLPRAARSPKIPSMRRDVDHLPAVQRDELDRVQRVLMEEFAEAIAQATSPSRKNGKILKIILFGSYARDDWVDETENGYPSGFDLLVVGIHADATEIAQLGVVH